MRDTRTVRLSHQHLLRKASNRAEPRALTLKSIKQNKNQNPESLAYLLSISSLPKPKYSTSRHRNLCGLTGKSGSYYRLAGLSRHALKRRATLGLAQNIKTKSW